MKLYALIDAAQKSHGLRAPGSDYIRYRRYCTRRIARLRKRSGDKGLIALFNAERAWAYAMELKESQQQESRHKFRFKKRLAKAVRHSEEVQYHAGEEAHAYHLGMQGHYFLARSRLAEAGDAFEQALDILNKLDGPLFDERKQLLQPWLRYCRPSPAPPPLPQPFPPVAPAATAVAPPPAAGLLGRMWQRLSGTTN